MGINYLLHNYVKENQKTLSQEKIIINEIKRKTPKGESTNEIKLTHARCYLSKNLVQKAKNYPIISAYMNIKRKISVCALNDGMPMILQVTK